ncbi:MAG: DUF4105 domain-containing protein, partial [Deltaproteobacteria bacterium]
MLILLIATASAVRAQAAVSWAPGGSATGEDLQIKIVTFGPGDDIASWFGHGAVLVENTRTGEKRVYNFGMFSFGPEMWPKFLMGRLEFWVGEASWPRTLQVYRALNRDIRVQTLNLPPEKRLEMARALAVNVRPENRTYLYHHYFNNCVTRIRDLIDAAVDGQLRAQNQALDTLTFRDHTRRHTEHNPYIDQILVFWMNDEIDKPITLWDAMFLPTVMEARLDAATYVNAEGKRVPLVAKKEVLYTARGRPPTPDRPSTRWPYTLLFGLVVGALPVGLAEWRRRRGSRLPRVLLGLHTFFVGLLYGLPALILFLMWTFTEHTVTWRNENLFFANPLTAAAIVLGPAIAWGSPRAARWMRLLWTVLCVTSAAGVLVKVLPWFDQDNLLPMTLL